MTIFIGAPAQLQRDHGGASIDPPDPFAGQAFRLDHWCGQERPGCLGRRVRRDPGQDDLPL
jgi:hypothetical protein